MTEGRNDRGRGAGRCSLAAVALAAAVISGGAGCGDMGERWSRLFKRSKTEDSAPVPARESSKAVQDTVQGTATVEGLRVTVVRGYGLVVGLVGTGGSDAPDDVRKYLQQEILRRRTGISSKELLDSRDTAIVVVTGEVPAAAMSGERFDVVVRAMGNQTTSLDGGMLLECDLKLLAATPRGIIEGKTFAVAAGPIFMTPFRRGEEKGDDLRVGRVLGGGMLKESRRLRIVLDSPTYNIAARIRDRLNSRYGAAAPVADAVSPDVIQLTVPSSMRGNEKHFLDLVLHTTINGAPAFIERRAAEMAEEIQHPQAPYDAISLAWEAMGRTVLPAIRPIYSHPTVAARFYAARAGMRLGDSQAVGIIVQHALASGDPFRLVAIEELANPTAGAAAADALQTLAGDPDNRVRVAAYKVMLQRRHPSISPEAVGGQFVLDVVECGGPPLVFVAASEQQRLALLGRKHTLRAPASYRDEDVTIAIDEGDREFRIVRVNPRSKQASPLIRCGLDLREFIRLLGERPGETPDGRPIGLGLTYSGVVRVLNELHAQGALPGAFMVDRPSVSDELWKIRTPSRPESEF